MTADVKRQVELDVLKMIVYANEKLMKPFRDSFRGANGGMGETGLSSMQTNALCLLENYGSLTMKELAARMKVSKQQMTKTANRLAEKGMISREKSLEDGRVTRVSLSKRGKDYLSCRNLGYISKLCDKIEKTVDPYDFDRFSNAVVTLNDIFEELDGKE